ncbi:MAG: alpha/beta fold hydrolase [Gemmatimonadaceae bacterium]
MTNRIGRIVAGSLIAGFVTAIILVAIPFAGAPENVISGVVLVAFGLGWALLAVLSTAWTEPPQRWAALPAGVFLVAGAALVAWPASVKVAALAWIWPPVLLALVVWMTIRARQQLRSRTRVWLLYPVFAILACSALGATYENVQELIDRAEYPMPGRLVDVGGRRLHLNCVGSGSPTVVLFPGAGDFTPDWGWIAPTVARSSRVCMWDRAGRGWSDDAAGPQDGVALTTDLHTLLERAQVDGPFVLAGHSFGGLAALNYAARYPKQVAGMVLLDGTSTEMFTRLHPYPTIYEAYRRVSAVFPSLARLGVGRIAYRSAFDSLPLQSRRVERAFWSTARLARSQRDEWAEAPALMRQARALESLDERPLIVLTALREAQDGWLPLQDDLARLSSNVEHRIVANSTHASLTVNEGDARASSQAIVDVVMAVRTGRRLSLEIAGGRSSVAR